MTISVTHPFVSSAAEGADATKVRTSNWNAGHTVNLTGPALVGRQTASQGAASEITVGAGLSLSGGVLSATGGAAYTPQSFQQPMTVAFAGDSIGLAMGSRDGTSAFAFAALELYPCEYDILLNSAVGGTTTDHLITTQIAQLEALTVKPDVVVVQSVQNDYIGSVATADTLMGYLIEYSERALAAGVKLVVLCSRPPKQSADVASAWYYFNRRVDRYCRDTPGNYFWDTASAWRQTTASESTGVNWRPSVGVVDAFSVDGTHPSAAANRSAASGIVPVLQRFARPLSPMICAAVAYDNTNWPYNNLLGIDGMMIGTSGQLNGVDNTGVAGSAAVIRQRWQLAAADGITATPTIVVGDDGYRYQQIVLSGTASADTTVKLSLSYVFDVTTGTFVGEAIVKTIDLVGSRGIGFKLGPSTHGFIGVSDIAVGTTNMHLRTGKLTHSNSGYAGVENYVEVSIASGKTVSGTVQIGRMGVYRIS